VAELVVTYFFYDLLSFDLLAVLPLHGVSFGLRMNTSGSFSGSIDMADPVVEMLDVATATRPGRTLIIVDIDGSIVWSGIIWTRTFTKSSRILGIGGNEAWSYWAHRIQSVDYTDAPEDIWWRGNPEAADYIAAQILIDAQRVPGTAFPWGTALVMCHPQFPSGFTDPITASYPLSQLQTVDQMVSNLAAGGYGTGFDYTMTASWQNGVQGSVPIFGIDLWYPRLGAAGSQESPVVTIGVGAQEVDYTWPEDSTVMAWKTYATGGQGGGLSFLATDDAPQRAGWPLLEATTSYAEVNNQSAIIMAALSDLANQEWPVTVPSVTLPLFGTDATGTKIGPALEDLSVGGDIRVVIAPDEFFEQGVDVSYMRVIGIDATIADSGLSTMVLTLNMPPAQAPVLEPPTASSAPVYRTTTVAEAPTLTSVVGGVGVITLQWIYDGPTNASFTVLRSTSPSDEVAIASGITTLSFVDATAATSVTYYYRVEAVVPAVGVSPPSNELSALSLPLPPPPVATGGIAVAFLATAPRIMGPAYGRIATAFTATATGLTGTFPITGTSRIATAFVASAPVPTLVMPITGTSQIATAFAATGTPRVAWDTMVTALSPIAWFKQTEASGTVMTDSSASAHNGVYGTGVTFGQPGPILGTPAETAITLSGSGNIPYATSIAGYEVGSATSLTFGIWFKTTASGAYQALVGHGSISSAQAGYMLRLDSASQQIAAGIADGTTLVGTTPTGASWNDNAWHFALAVIDRTAQVLRVYVDGNLIQTSASISGVGSISNAALVVSFGGNAGGTQKLTGSTAHGLLLPGVLTGAQITSLYQSGIAH
jgi:Concanavalin A-like lectin/glucanases superfamily